MKDQQDFTGCIGATMLFIAGLIVNAIVGGWALKLLWRWFIMPLSESVPPISIAWAIGLHTTIAFVAKTSIRDETYGDDPWANALKSVIYGLLYSLFAVLVGWIVVSFL